MWRDAAIWTYAPFAVIILHIAFYDQRDEIDAQVRELPLAPAI
jgi:hypothetical protein